MAGKMTFAELMQRNQVGGQALQPFFSGLGLNEWRTTGGGVNEAGETQYSEIANPDALSKANGYTFDFTGNGPANTGYLTAYDPSGGLVGNFQQQDSTFGQGLMDWAKLAAIGFGGAGLAGLGPLGGMLGGAGGASGGLSGVDAAMADLAASGGITPGALGSGELAAAGGGLADFGGYSLAADGVGSMAPEMMAANGIDAATLYGGELGAATAAAGSSPFSWGSLAKSAIGPALSTGLQMYGANKAAGAMQDATNRANELDAPALAARNSALAQMQALLKDPSTITKSPDYQFGLDAGTKALNNGAAARGMTYSGAQGKALQRYGQDYAGTKLDQSFNRLNALASAGQPGATATSNNITAQGNTDAAKYLVGGNALGTAVNGLTAYGQRQGWWGAPG